MIAKNEVFVGVVNTNLGGEVCFVADSEEKVPKLCKEVALNFQHYEGTLTEEKFEEASECQWFFSFNTGYKKHIVEIDKLVLNEPKPMG